MTFFPASNKLTASLPTIYLNSGLSIKIAWTIVFATSDFELFAASRNPELSCILNF
jgi:hypothetical protein